jgi:hypothetical protein
VTAFETLVAALRERHPPTPDRIARLAHRQRKLGHLGSDESLPDGAMDRYYAQLAVRLVGSFLDQLNDEELELRLAYDQAAAEEIDEYEDDEGEIRKRRLVTPEQLGWTVAEVARRKAKRERPPPPTPQPAVVLSDDRFSPEYLAAQKARRTWRRR